jgi:NDP-sugar pyrophosphorylase family protein
VSGVIWSAALSRRFCFCGEEKGRKAVRKHRTPKGIDVKPNLSNVTAAILAGGLGTRLQPVVADRPKVLAPVAGRPYLTHLLDQLADASASDVVLLTGYRANQVKGVLGDSYRGMRLRHSVEPSPLGTGGAIRHALGLLASQRVLLLNGDSYIEVDLGALLERHDERNADVSLVLCRVNDTSRFGRVELDGEDRIVRFEEKRETAGAGWINAGVCLMERHVIRSIVPGRVLSLERDLLPRWLARLRVMAHRTEGRFLDIGTPESYAQGDHFFAQPYCPRDTVPFRELAIGTPSGSGRPATTTSRPCR